MLTQLLSRVRLFDPTDCSPAGSSVYGILQARVLEWGACLPRQDLPNAGTEPVSTTAPELNHYCWATREARLICIVTHTHKCGLLCLLSSVEHLSRNSSENLMSVIEWMQKSLLAESQRTIVHHFSCCYWAFWASVKREIWSFVSCFHL